MRLIFLSLTIGVLLTTKVAFSQTPTIPLKTLASLCQIESPFLLKLHRRRKILNSLKNVQSMCKTNKKIIFPKKRANTLSCKAKSFVLQRTKQS